jgi:hypothetical protein
MSNDNVDLEKLQKEYASIEDIFSRFGSELTDVKDRLAAIAAAQGEEANSLSEYHRRTVAQLKKTLLRMEETHQQLLEIGVKKLAG